MKDRTKEGRVAQIDDLAKTIDTLAKGIAGLNPDIAEMQVQLKRASEDRELGITTKMKTVARTEEMGKQAQGDRKANFADLESLLSSTKNVQDVCNFLMKTYETACRRSEKDKEGG